MSANTSTAPVVKPVPIMKGGAKAYVIDIANKFSTPIHFYILAVLVLAITFVKKIPVDIRGQAGSVVGRVALFAATVYIGKSYSWLNGLLMAVLTLLLLSVSPRASSTEGFQPFDDISMKMVQDKKKWWVETVLKENPLGIQEETVQTKAIQDNSNSSNSNTSSK